MPANNSNLKTAPSTMLAPIKMPSKDPKTAASKQHRRSRSGCYTCRLRRKKCDEARSACKACKHLGLNCEYKRPSWWSNGEQRRTYKEDIKDIIKQTQLTKKSAKKGLPPSSVHTPPSLCHSIPTSDAYSDLPGSLMSSRDVSIDQSPLLSSDTEFLSHDGYFAIPSMSRVRSHPTHPMYSPYEIDVKTERQIFINDIPTRKDSVLSTFSTYQPPTSSSDVSDSSADTWIEHDLFESSKELFSEEPIDSDFFDLPNGELTPTHESVIEVDEADQPLLDHFLDKVMKLIFPVLDANHHGSAGSGIILPALETNRCYLHCCLDVAAVHKKSTDRTVGDRLDADIVRHRYSIITELCAAFERTNEQRDERSYTEVLEATLAVIFFQGRVGRPDEALPEVAWHQHMQAVVNVVGNLDLPKQLLAPVTHHIPSHPPFNMTLTAWIDILGATMLGHSPAFADMYRELNLAGRSAGLAELMGCDDRVMYLISEVACLEARNLEGMPEVMLCKYIEVLGQQISLTEDNTVMIQSAMSASGAIRPKQLAINMTAVYRLAARIYLVAMVPGLDLDQASLANLVAAFADHMDFIPGGLEGFDRSLVWPLLVAGSVSRPNSLFRSMFAQRCARLGDAAELGSFGRMRHLLRDVWAHNDGLISGLGAQPLHWRDAMLQKGWDCLLI